MQVLSKKHKNWPEFWCWGFERQFCCVLLCLYEYLIEMQTQIICEEGPLFSPSSLDVVNVLVDLPGWILVCSLPLN